MEHDLVLASIRIVFLFLVPVILVALASGILVSALQTATAIKEPGLSYAARLLGVVVGLYFVLPSSASSLAELLTWALK